MTESQYDAFRVPAGLHWFSQSIQRTRWFWRWLGGIETQALAEQLKRVRIDRPCYVAGLPRSGSTLLLEILAAHPQVATHRYCDFPMIYTPYWWRNFVSRSAGPVEPTERAHGDRLMVTPQSPEAMEEGLWMAFFSHLHDEQRSNVLDERTENARFEKFYRDHLTKLLLVEKKSRYASKGNYNITRLAYLRKLFPDARFLLPIRTPRDHIASLWKQHRLFTAAVAQHPRAAAHLAQVGHFEFGPGRRVLNLHNSELASEISQLWSSGEEVRGWARYWAGVYEFVAEQLKTSPGLADQVLIVRYEDLCRDPQTVMREMFAHVGLSAADDVIERFVPQITPPAYYRPTFTPDEEEIIQAETLATAERFGYEVAARPAAEVVASPCPH